MAHNNNDNREHTKQALFDLGMTTLEISKRFFEIHDIRDPEALLQQLAEFRVALNEIGNTTYELKKELKRQKKGVAA